MIGGEFVKLLTVNTATWLVTVLNALLTTT